MFEDAIRAATAMACDWTPERPERTVGSRCCRLCFERYAVLVLNGPLRDLPHAVAHAAIVVVDGVIIDRLDARLSEPASRPPEASDGTARRDPYLALRARAARGGLVVVALEELGAAEAHLAQLRRRYTEPAFAGYLEHVGIIEVPPAWIA